MRWSGYRRVRSQVCKRLGRQYRAYLEANREEWRELDARCRITISRFGRDRAVFASLRERVLPVLARSLRERGEAALRVWSIGCAAGEEPYTLVLLWHLYLQPWFPDLALRITATDADEVQLRRAQEALYPASSLRELPPALRAIGFEQTPAGFRLRLLRRRPATRDPGWPDHPAGPRWRARDRNPRAHPRRRVGPDGVAALHPSPGAVAAVGGPLVPLFGSGRPRFRTPNRAQRP
jgi:hypothetical protein